MNKRKCGCDKENFETSCSLCDKNMAALYWCETCQRYGSEKRCPGCGLKTRKGYCNQKDQGREFQSD